MSDASDQSAEDWSSYLRRMTKRPGWSVARLAREAGIHRGTIFAWISEGTGKRGVTTASVLAVAAALGDDPAVALRAAGGAADDSEVVDEEIELVRTDAGLTAQQRKQIIDMILERRERERGQGIENTRRLIEIMKSDVG